MKMLLLLAAIILFDVSVYAQEATPLFVIDIAAEGGGQYKGLALTPEILNHSGTEALRVIERGTEEAAEETPFFIHQGEYFSEQQQQFYELTGFRLRRRQMLRAQAKARFTAESSSGRTTVTLTGVDGSATMRNLAVTAVRLETDSHFKREVRTHQGRQTLYRLFFRETALENTVLRFSGAPQWEEQLTFDIIDHDDRPITIERIIVEYYVSYVVFRAEPGTEYSLLFGGGLTRPRYDIENFRDLIIEVGFDIAALQGSARVLTQPVPEEPADFRLLFNIAIIIAAVVLGVVAVVSLGKRRG